MRRHGATAGERTGATWDGNATVFKKIALPIALAYVLTLVCCVNDEIVCLKNRRDVARDIARAIALVCLSALSASFEYIIISSVYDHYNFFKFKSGYRCQIMTSKVDPRDVNVNHIYHQLVYSPDGVDLSHFTPFGVDLSN